MTTHHPLQAVRQSSPRTPIRFSRNKLPNINLAMQDTRIPGQPLLGPTRVSILPACAFRPTVSVRALYSSTDASENGCLSSVHLTTFT